MGMFTRQDYDRLAHMVEEIRHASRESLLEKRQSGFAHKRIDEECDRTLQTLKGKLAATRLILQDKDRMKRSPAFTFLIVRTTKAWLWRRAAVNFTEVPQHLCNDERMKEWAQNNRTTLIVLRGRGKMDKTSSNPFGEEEVEEDYDMGWQKCSVEVGRQLVTEGEWGEDNEGNPVFRATYTVRFIGEWDSKDAFAEFAQVGCTAAVTITGGEAEKLANPPVPPISKSAHA